MIRTLPRAILSRSRQSLKEWKYAPVEKLIGRLAPRTRRLAWTRRYHAWRAARQPALVSQLAAILAQTPQPRAVIVFVPGLDWERQLFQRPQQMARALARQGALVLYAQLAPPANGAPITRVEDRLYLCAVPLELLAGLTGSYVYTLTWNRKYLLKLAGLPVVYDHLDDLAAFAGDASQLARDHHALMGEAALVTASARRLVEADLPARPDVLYVPNGVDFAHFAGEPAGLPPEMSELRSQGKPVIGFYGALAGWFDYALVDCLARSRPDLNFVLIGPKHDGSLDASGLLGVDNLHYLGPKPYADLPAYLAGFDVAMLPFQINAVTQSTSPVKLFEYLAGGKPVVSTPLREVLQYQEVLTARDAAEFSAQIDRALALAKDPGQVERLRAVARQNTWDDRAGGILQALENIPIHNPGQAS